MTVKSGTGFSSKGIMTATIKTVKFGPLEFEGLLLEDGNFAIAISQLAVLNLVSPNPSPKELEILGLVIPDSFKVKTAHNTEAVDCILLSDFELVVRILDKLGVAVAVDMVDAAFGVAVAELYGDAFRVRTVYKDGNSCARGPK